MAKKHLSIQKTLVPLDWDPKSGFNEWIRYIREEVSKSSSNHSITLIMIQPFDQDRIEALRNMNRLAKEAQSIINK